MRHAVSKTKEIDVWTVFGYICLAATLPPKQKSLLSLSYGQQDYEREAPQALEESLRLFQGPYNNLWSSQMVKWLLSLLLCWSLLTGPTDQSKALIYISNIVQLLMLSCDMWSCSCLCTMLKDIVIWCSFVYSVYIRCIICRNIK